MAIKLRSTLEVAGQATKIIVYGAAKVGKTTLATTMPKPAVILSTENGLLSIADADMPFIEITSIADMIEAYEYVMSEEGSKFKSIIIDSITDIGNIMLIAEKKNSKDPRAAYGTLNDTFGELLRKFRSLNDRHVLIIAERERIEDEEGRQLYGPSMPGKRLTQSLPHLYDGIFALRAEKNPEGQLVRALMTETDGLWAAGMRKSKSVQLEPYEAPDMSAIIAKLGGVA